MDEHLKYLEKLDVILDKNRNTLHNKVVGLVKVQWQHRKGSEWTLEYKEEMMENYPELYAVVDFKEEV